MSATEGFDLWWLIPLILIGLCLICCRGCCRGRYRRQADEKDREVKETTITPTNKGETR